MITLPFAIDQATLATLPLVAFEGRIITILTVPEAEKAVDYLLSQPLLGFDTETRPAFRKGVTYATSLLQVATADTCFLFRLNRIGMPPCILRLLSDRQVTKVGLSLKDDFMKLQQAASFERGSFVDIQDYAAQMGIKERSLRKLYAIFYGERISKTQQVSNWEADVLTTKQQIYAATDAWCCVRLYERMHTLLRSGDYRIASAKMT